MIKQSRKRENLIALLNSLATQIIQGSLVTLKGPCGKASCACAKSKKHYHKRYYLSWTEDGRTHMMYISSKQLRAFQQGVRAWSRFKEISKQLARINAKTLKLEKGDTI